VVEGELYFPDELALLALEHEGDLDPGLLEVAGEGTQRSRPGLALDGKGFERPHRALHLQEGQFPRTFDLLPCLLSLNLLAF